MPRSVMMPVMYLVGVTSKAGLRTFAPVGRELRGADVRHLARVALLDRDGAPSGVARSMVDSGAAT